MLKIGHALIGRSGYSCRGSKHSTAFIRPSGPQRGPHQVVKSSPIWRGSSRQAAKVAPLQLARAEATFDQAFSPLFDGAPAVLCSVRRTPGACYHISNLVR
jgi:hypothetical protein